MSFRKIDSQLKLDVIQALWGGASYSELSIQYGIPRATIYKWEQTAKDAIVNAFESKTPGKRTLDLEEENNVLKKQLHYMYHDKHSTAQNDLAESKPVICNQCGSSHIKKNGTLLTKTDGLKQRYSCPNCSLSIYVVVKKTPPMSK